MLVSRLKTDGVGVGDHDIGVHAMEFDGTGEFNRFYGRKKGVEFLTLVDFGENISRPGGDFGVERVWFLCWC